MPVEKEKNESGKSFADQKKKVLDYCEHVEKKGQLDDALMIIEMLLSECPNDPDSEKTINNPYFRVGWYAGLRDAIGLISKK